MAVLRIQGFSGRVPAIGDRALQDNYAVDAMNTYLYGSELRGVRPPVPIVVDNLKATTRRIFRIPRRTTGVPPSSLTDSYWLQFDDIDTDVVKGQLIEDKFERYYFCSPSTGPMYNTFPRIKAGDPPFKLGVPGPNTDIAADGSNPDRPIVSIAGGAEPRTTRFYVYTWANEFGEESTPSLPSEMPDTLDNFANAVWTVSNIKDPPPLAGYAAYTKKFLYRTVTGESGQTTYYRVIELPIGTTVYADNSDTLTDAIIVGNLVIESTSWAMPPSNLQGFIAMPNGFLIGFDKPDPVTRAGGNNIYMSEPYHWHAWPAEYKQATEAPIVGLGILGSTCVVCTESYPTAVTGANPAVCSFVKATTGEPCLSRGSIVSTTQGVIYASQNGLMMVGPSGISNVTKDLITRDDWLTVYHPETFRAARYQEGYLALQDLPPTETNKGFLLDPSALKVALTEFTDFSTFLSLNVDIWSGEVFVIRDGSVLHWDPPTKDLMPIRWLSKEFQYQFKENFGAYAIYWDDKRYSDADWGNGVLPRDQKVKFIAYANRRKVYEQVVPRNGAAVRLPSGFKADIWQFEIRARAPVYSLHVASTMKELKSV